MHLEPLLDTIFVIMMFAREGGDFFPGFRIFLANRAGISFATVGHFLGEGLSPEALDFLSGRRGRSLVPALASKSHEIFHVHESEISEDVWDSHSRVGSEGVFSAEEVEIERIQSWSLSLALILNLVSHKRAIEKRFHTSHAPHPTEAHQIFLAKSLILSHGVLVGSTSHGPGHHPAIREPGGRGDLDKSIILEILGMLVRVIVMILMVVRPSGPVLGQIYDRLLPGLRD